MSQETYEEKINKIYKDYKDYIETRLKVIDDSADVVTYSINLHIFNDEEMKQHDKELVAKVLKEVEDSFTAYLPLRNRTGAWFYGRLNEILKKYQKEFEDGK